MEPATAVSTVYSIKFTGKLGKVYTGKVAMESPNARVLVCAS